MNVTNITSFLTCSRLWLFAFNGRATRRLRLKAVPPLAGVLLLFFSVTVRADDPETVFRQPPPEARPWVYWFWMGSTITADGITGDLQALHDAGFGGSVMCSMADICTPWPAPIGNPPTPDIITFNDKWWQLVRHAAQDIAPAGP